jgi:hypothetical protein
VTLPPIPTIHGPLKWECDGCHKWSFWTDQHMVYGSMKDEDEENWSRLIVTCSVACREATIAAGRAAAIVHGGWEPRPT